MDKSRCYYLLETGLDEVLGEHVPVGDRKSRVVLRQESSVSFVTPHTLVGMSRTWNQYSGFSSGFFA